MPQIIMESHIQLNDNEYGEWLKTIKRQIQSAKIRIAKAANTELIFFYWQLGGMISRKLQANNWGDKIISKLSADLQKEFPDVQGFSRQNLYFMKKFYECYSEKLDIHPEKQIISQRGRQLQIPDNYKVIFDIPWGHQKVIISKSHLVDEALFYVRQTLENSWKRETLENQIKQHFYEHYKKGQTNFTCTLPAVTADMAQEIVKDPYWFDFISVSQKAHERDIEKQLVAHITQFLLALGKGFAFVGEQYCLRLQEKEYFCDLLFYHIPLRTYVVIELKNSSFKPEHLGQLNFYQNLINGTLKTAQDNPTIGMLLCRDKNRIEVEYALQNIAAPIGVSEFNINELLPEKLKSSLPTVEEMEEELNKFVEQ